MKHLFKILILLAAGASARGAIVANPFTTNNWLSSITDTNKSIWNVKDFGAVGNGKLNNTAAMVSNSAALTVSGSPFAANDVGKVVTVYQAGVKPSGWVTTNQALNLTGTILSFTDANHVTLSTNCQTTVNSSHAIWGTDDTDAINRGIHYLCTNNINGGGTLFFPSGIYIVNGAPVNPGPNGAVEGKNAQLWFPDPTGSTTGPWMIRTIKFAGPLPFFQRQLLLFELPPWTNYGTCILSTVSDLNGASLISTICTNAAVASYGNSSPRYGGLGYYVNPYRFEAENINFRVAGNSTGPNLNLQACPAGRLRDCLIDTGYPEYSVQGKPMNTNGYGLIEPSSSSGGQFIEDNLQVVGFYTGVLHGEHVEAYSVAIYSCLNAYETGLGGHYGWMNVDIEDTYCFFTNRLASFCNLIGHVTSENAHSSGSPWSWPMLLVSDPLNALSGDIMLTTAYASDMPPMNGGTHIVWRLMAGTNNGNFTSERYASSVNFSNIVVNAIQPNQINGVSSAGTVINMDGGLANELDIYFQNSGHGWFCGTAGTEGGGVGQPYAWRFYSTDLGKNAVSITGAGDLNVVSNLYIFGTINGNGSGVTNIPISAIYGGTNFTVYAAGTAYTYTGSHALLHLGTTDPSVTINQAGTYLLTGSVGVKYSGATYAAAQSVTNTFRRTNNTASDIANGKRVTELPVLTTFTGGDVLTLPPTVYTAASGDIIQIYGALTATPAAGSVLADSAEIVAVRLY